MNKYISYDERTNTISFSGDDSSAIFANQAFSIQINLIGKNGTTNNYVQTLLLRPKDESLTEDKDDTVESSVAAGTNIV